MTGRIRADYAGQRFGQVQLIRFHSLGRSQQSLWWGVCDCGTERPFDVYRLKIGRVKSCGCAVHNSNPRPPRITEADIPEIKRLYTVERLSLDGVGARYGVSGASILYWLRKGGIATRKVGSPKQQFKVTPKHRQSAARKGVMSQAAIAAQEFRQESLIAFPESPQLQADYDAIMAGVRAERGTPWTAGIGSISDRAGR